MLAYVEYGSKFRKPGEKGKFNEQKFGQMKLVGILSRFVQKVQITVYEAQNGNLEHLSLALS